MTAKGEGLTLARTAIVGVLIAIAAVLLLTWCVIHGYSIDEQAKAVEITKDILTIMALALGAFWSLRIYVKQRNDAFAVDVKQSVAVIPLPQGWLLKVNATIRNVGKTRVELTLWRYRADLLLPLPSEVEKATTTASAFSESSAPWPTIAEATLSDEDFGFFIEPGATQAESANIILPGWVETVQIYSFFSGPPDLTRGWWDRTLIDLRKELAHGDSDTLAVQGQDTH
jgi:hypothetical protein